MKFLLELKICWNYVADWRRVLHCRLESDEQFLPIHQQHYVSAMYEMLKNDKWFNL
jgi:hypothetical protein